MAIKNIQVDGVDYAVKDETARSNIGDLSQLTTEAKDNLVNAVNELSAKAGSGSCPIQRIESLDESNLKNLRDLETGSYVLYGYFRPFAGAPNYLPFDNLLVNVYHVNEGSHLFEFSTANSEVNFIEILVDASAEGGHTYSRTAFNLLELNGLIDKVGNLAELATTEKSNLVAAINEAAASGGSGDGASGSSVQPDFNQNDESAADYIKNRAFYTGEIGEKVYCDATVMVSDGCGYIFPAPILTPDTTYKVVFNGVEYEATYNGETLGNEDLWGGWLDYELAEGELPFCVDYAGELGTTADGEHTVKIYRMEPIVHTMDPVYLPPEYKPAVNIQRLANISSYVETYKATPEAWAKTFALAKAVLDGECVPYCTLQGKLACGIETIDPDDAKYFMAYYVIYENGRNVGNQTFRIQTMRYSMRAQYDFNTQTVTVTPVISNHAEPVWEIPIAGSELGGVKNGGNVVINADGTITAPALPTGGTPGQVLTIGEDGNPVWADPPAGAGAGITVSAALMGPGAAIVDGVTLSTMEIPDETEETTE